MTIMAKIVDIPFEVFWKQYGLERNRLAAKKAWDRMSVKARWDAFFGIEPYRQRCQQEGVAMKYPQGYLNGRRWEDELDTKETPAVQVQEEGPSAAVEMEIW